MNPKTVIFIEPSGNKTNVFDNYMRLPLMGSLYLGTILKNAGYHVRIYNENILSKTIDPFELNADVFCITALTVSANRAKLLAGQLKHIYPESLVVVGGIHASLLPDDFLDVADHVVIGEAEEIILDIVARKYTDKVIHGSQTIDPEQLPLIDYSLLEGYKSISTIPVMTSRGCPFDCTFCTVTKIFGRKFRMQSAERVIAEIENAIRHFGRINFFFYDDNFTANKKRVYEICDAMIAKRMNIAWSAQVRTDLARDPDLIDRMAKAGLRWVYIGFESIDDETLKSLHKSQTRAEIEDSIRCFHDHGVHIHGMFMFGADTDTKDTVANTLVFTKAHSIDTVQFMILTPFPGTQCYDALEREHRLFHKNWDYYNGMFVVFQTKRISPSRLLKDTYAAYRSFYSLRRTFFESLLIVVNAVVDAFVWNFSRANRYGMQQLFLRAGAKTIVNRYSNINEAYLHYLMDMERKHVLEPEKTC